MRDLYYVFVYRTLMRGERAHAFLEDAKFLGDYSLKDYAMYNLGWFPGIRPSVGDRVFGEVYEVDLDKLQNMDGYEGEGTLYHRTLVVVENDNESLNAFAYIFAHDNLGEKIKGGKWNEKE